MITRLSLPIDILHDERIVALVADCGPESIAVLISLLAILRRRGSIDRDRFLISKIRHDLSYTLDEAAINAILDHLEQSGYLRATGDTGRRGRLAPSGEPSGEPSCKTSAETPCTPPTTSAAIDSPDSIDSIVSLDSPMRGRDAPSPTPYESRHEQGRQRRTDMQGIRGLP